MKKIIFLLLFTCITFFTYAQRTVNGYVYDEAKMPLIGANVIEKGTDNGITTDFDGFFELELTKDEATLVVSYTGYEEKEIKVKKSDAELKIELKADKTSLSEVVISSYGTEKESRSKERKKKDRKYKESIFSGRASSAPASMEAPKMSPPPPPPPPTMTVPTDMADDIMPDVIVEEAYSFDAAAGAVGGKGGSSKAPAAGKLTAGILNDFSKWELWQDIQESELKTWQTTWGVRPWDRFTVQLSTRNAYPIVDAQVELMDGKESIWRSRTDNTGKAELWAQLYQLEETDLGNYKIKVTYKGKEHWIEDAKPFHEGINTKVVNEKCDIPDVVDINFVVDATGSMGDEIEYLKSELNDVIARSKKNLEDVELRLGSVFYRDHGDAYVTRKSHFSTDVNKVMNFIKAQGAAGGGDGPEAIEEALDEALDNMNWSENATARLLFLVLDAPPHQNKEIKERIQKQMLRASEMGVRIIPVACSGTDRSNEFLMRSFCLTTNGSYIYLTDDSGIGGSHLEPITDERKVNKLNDMLVEIIKNFATTVSCDEQIAESFSEEVSDTSQVEMVVAKTGQDPTEIIKETVFSWKYYPNPSSGDLWVDLDGELDYLYLMDGAGKLLERYAINSNNLQLDLNKYPSGMYYLKGFGENDNEVSGKVILIRNE